MIKVGIVGCGNIARSIHIPALLSMKGVEIVAICDNNERQVNEVREMFGIGRSYSNFVEMLLYEGLDLIDICTPPQTHAPLAIQAMDAGCHVLVEKPFVSTVAEADAVIESSRKNGVKLCVIHNYLFIPVVMKAKSIIENGEIGELLGITVNFLDRPDVEFNQKTHWSHKLPGGRFGENIIHPLYLIDHFLNITDIAAVQAKKIGHCEWSVYDEMRVLLETENSIGTIIMSTNAPNTDNSMTIYGTKGSVRIDFNPYGIFVRKAKEKTALYPFLDYVNDSLKLLANTLLYPPKWYLTKPYIYSGHYNIIKEFIKSINEDRAPPVTGESARKMMALQEKIFAGRSGNRNETTSNVQ